MRITSNSQYLQSIYSSSLQKSAETAESTSTTETLDNEAILEKLKEEALARTYENTSDYGDLIASGQMAKMNFRIQPVEETGDTASMEAIRNTFDTIRDSDIESLSAEGAKNAMRPSGPRPAGPPPGAQGASSTETEETTALETLEELLERLSEEEDEETISSVEELLNNWAEKITALKNSKTESTATAASAVSES